MKVTISFECGPKELPDLISSVYGPREVRHLKKLYDQHLDYLHKEVKA